MRIVLDMNLSPDWVGALRSSGIDASHWSSIGRAEATDREIMEWAREHGFVVLTYDLDFATLLAHTRALGPSVIQIRSRDLFPHNILEQVINAIQVADALVRSGHAGVLVTVDADRHRIRHLPLLS